MAIENELPPPVTGDAAHALEAARLTIAAQQRHIEGCEQNVTELQAEVRRLQGQWDQAEAHNNDLSDDLVKLRAQLATVRAFCQAEQKYARTAVMQGDNPAHWTTRSEQAQKVLDILKAGL